MVLFYRDPASTGEKSPLQEYLHKYSTWAKLHIPVFQITALAALKMACRFAFLESLNFYYYFNE